MTQASVLVGVDVGTTSAKAVVTTSSGQVLGEYSAAYRVLTPRPLWAEQWPDVWFDGMAAAVRGVLETAAVEPNRVAALAVSSLYGGSGIPVDRDLRPLYPCLIWMDRRAGKEAAWVQDNVGTDRLVEITGNGVDSYYGFTKMLWLKNHEPDVWRDTRYFVPPNAFLIHRLTGQLAVDHSSAGNIGGVYDIRNHAWSSEMCDALGIPLELMPERIVPSETVVGGLHADGAATLGLPKGTPVVAGGVDAAVATLSAGVLRPGQHVAMMGTSMCWGFIHPEAPREAGLVSMPYVFRAHDNTYTFGGAATAGAVVNWFKDQLGGVEDAVEHWVGEALGETAYSLLDKSAAKVPAGADGLLMLPYMMGERSPIWDANARGTIIGLTLYHTRAHLFRAFLEGVAFALRHNIDAGRKAGYELDDLLMVVGGAAKSSLWLRILAGVTKMPIMAAASGGEAAFGDAMLAALATDLTDGDELDSWIATADLQRRIEPDSADEAAYDAMYPHYVALYEDLKLRFASMAKG